MDLKHIDKVMMRMVEPRGHQNSEASYRFYASAPEEIDVERICIENIGARTPAMLIVAEPMDGKKNTQWGILAVSVNMLRMCRGNGCKLAGYEVGPEWGYPGASFTLDPDNALHMMAWKGEERGDGAGAYRFIGVKLNGEEIREIKRELGALITYAQKRWDHESRVKDRKLVVKVHKLGL